MVGNVGFPPLSLGGDAAMMPFGEFCTGAFLGYEQGEMAAAAAAALEAMHCDDDAFLGDMNLDFIFNEGDAAMG